MTPAEVPSAIYFHPDMMEGEGRQLVGRRSAGSSFFEGYLAHGPQDRIRALVERRADGEALKALLDARGETRPLDLIRLSSDESLERFGTIFHPGPGVSAAAWHRLRHGGNTCSLVGLTHTMSTRRIIEALHSAISDPVESWDAIICTSRAVRDVVGRQFACETQYFRQRFGATRVPLPHLPMIPLGIDAMAFAPRDGARDRVRAQLGAPEDAVVVMTMGRLSVVEKANPVPLFLALESVARESGRPIHLWVTGWASRDEEETLYRKAMSDLCPSVTARIVDGREAGIRRDIWAAADIFSLPSDSVQETFGLVPVEAMAAGLPVVVPDWDGFRDTVRHGITGFRVPTRMPAGDSDDGRALAARFADKRDGYLQYLAVVQASVQIDVPAYTRALATLVADADLRRRMGQAGQDHVRAHYDWRHVIPAYQQLAAILAEKRAGAVPTTRMLSRHVVSPIEIDPYIAYASYPTDRIEPQTPLHPGRPLTPETLQAFLSASGLTLYGRMRGTAADLGRLAAIVTERPGLSLAQLATEVGAAPVMVTPLVLHLAKGDFLRLPQIAPRDAAG